jgi:hypothetical protein
MSQRLLHVADPRGCALRPSGTDTSKHLDEPCRESAGEHAVDDIGGLRVGYAHHPEEIAQSKGRDEETGSANSAYGREARFTHLDRCVHGELSGGRDV